MARIRSLKPEFWTSEQIVSCSRDARLLFIGIWTFSDDNGIHPKSFKRLKMEILPNDDCGEQDIAIWIDELIKSGLIIEYEVDQKAYWQVTGFRQHQRIEKPTYRFPPPNSEGMSDDDNSTTSRRMVGEYSTTSLQLVQNHSSTPLLRRGEERKGEDINICRVASAPLHSTSFTEKLPTVHTQSTGASYDESSSSEAKLPSSPKKAKNSKTIVTPEVSEIFSYWKTVMGRTWSKLDTKRVKCINSALENYTLEELKLAIDGCSRNPFNMGLNDYNKKYDDLGLILRDAAYIEGFIRDGQSRVSTPNSKSKIIEDLLAGAL